MCEPSHSIVQFPDRDDDDKPTGGSLDLVGPPTGADASVWDKMKKRIADWWHFSLAGFGHSESLERMTTRLRLALPQDTKYEAHWWERKVRLDGSYHGVGDRPTQEFQKKYALEAATQYAHKVSIGNLTLLRQFLEWSVRKSERPNSYKSMFGCMLTPDGRHEFEKKIRQFCGFCIEKGPTLETAIKIMLGFTRKRKLLVPEWADDDKLWTPKIILG